MAHRPALLAGRWYPGSAAACQQFFRQVDPLGEEVIPADAVAAIVPHAGWVYSGAVAYEALLALKGHRADPDLIVVFGGHLGRRHPPRLMVEGGWDTPFGATETPTELAQDVGMALSCDLESADDYFDDNAVEVQMPMIKHLWPDAPVLTLGVPPTDAAPNAGREVIGLAKERGFERIIVVGSTDMTHYGPNYDFVPHGRGQAGLTWVKTENDPELIGHMQRMDAAKVIWSAARNHNACCAGAIAASLTAARQLGAARGTSTRYTTSWDVRSEGAEPSSFVGYLGMLLGS